MFREQSFDVEQGGLFVPGEVDVALGEEVVLEISFLEEQVRFRIRAAVKWKRPASAASRRALPGVGLAFLPSEQKTQEQLLRFVDGEVPSHVERESRRYSLHLEIKVDGHGTKNTEDLSQGGCFLLWEDPPPIGTTLRVKLAAPGAIFSWITLPATVCWHRLGGDHAGCGLQFLFDSDRSRRRVDKLLAVLKERLVRELRVAPPSPSASSSKPPSVAPTPSMLPRK